MSCQPALPDLPEEPQILKGVKNLRKKVFNCGFLHFSEAICLVVMGSCHIRVVAHTVN